MYVTLRQYTRITPASFDLLMSRASEVGALIRQVSGFVRYDLVRTTNGITSITFCKDRDGAEASNLKVAAWIASNPPALPPKAPVITGGEQVVHFTA
jgi:hypothetical protein